MEDYINNIKSRDNKISILQSLVEKNDEHVSRLKNMIEQLKKQLKFEQEQNTEMTKDMNKLRETMQIQNQKIRDLQESLFQSKENERQMHTKIKDIQNSSPQRNQRFNSINKPGVEKGMNNKQEENKSPQNLGRKSTQDLGKYEEASPYARYPLNTKNSNSNYVPQIQGLVQSILSSENYDKSPYTQSDNTSTNQENKRKSPSLRLDSSIQKSQQSFIESPKLQKTMLSMVEEDLNNIIISASYQKELAIINKDLLINIIKIIFTIRQQKLFRVCDSIQQTKLQQDLKIFKSEILKKDKIQPTKLQLIQKF